MSFKNGRFRCWACGASGDSIDFVGRFLSLDALGAVRRLNDDFRLGLPINRKQTPQERAEAARAAAKRRELSDTAEAFAAWRGAMLDKLNACFRLAHLTMKAIATPSDIDRLTDAQALAIREQARIECLADVLTSGTTAEQMEVFRERRAINQLCEMILSSMPTKSGAA